jgi:hypothetical protein
MVVGGSDTAGTPRDDAGTLGDEADVTPDGPDAGRSAVHAAAATTPE